MGDRQCRIDELRRQWEADRWQVATTLARIEGKLVLIEAKCGEKWTSGQWLKASIGLGLLLAVLAATGNVKLARQLITLMAP